MESDVERRAARRFSMNLPMKVRFSAESGILEKKGETRDVSFRGLYFVMEAIVETGSPDRIRSHLASTNHPGRRRSHPLLRPRPARR